MLVCIPFVMLKDNYMRWSMANKKKPYFYDLSVCRKSMFLKQTSNSLPLSPCPLSPGKGEFYWGYRP